MAGILEVVIGGLALAAMLGIAQAWRKRYWRGTVVRVRAMWDPLKLLRKAFLARKQVRRVSIREFLSERRRIPLWLLGATVFRWFEATPATDWPYVMQVLEDHTNDQAKEEAKTLLWDVKTVQELKPRDIWEGKHVVLAHPCVKYVFVVTDASSSTEFSWSPRSAGQQALVQRGWCSNVREPCNPCQHCDRDDSELEQLADSIMSRHDCPPSPTHE